MPKDAKPAMPVEAMAIVTVTIVVAATLFQWVVISPEQPELALVKTFVASGAATVLHWPFRAG
ncbi:hypothetical protein [Methylobacterium sp. J-070]|uniref:hypothetical protein n=1 Tax=Methylobacterium sp. J-070 TaxID=2836650 RepID=UPI001FBACCB1|nr:hypothetical protein [Methylobacterium sp. J-070]MCJ2051243.1 hypothetical protein [Methylobacterium sp. J-070]